MARWAALQKIRWPASVHTRTGQSLGYWDDKNTRACFESDVQVRNFINSSRVARRLTTSKVGSPERTDGGADTVAVE